MGLTVIISCPIKRVRMKREKSKIKMIKMKKIPKN